MVLAGQALERQPAEARVGEMELPALLQFTLISQPGLPRRQVYYPFIAFRTSRVLQVPPAPPTPVLSDRLQPATLRYARLCNQINALTTGGNDEKKR